MTSEPAADAHTILVVDDDPDIRELACEVIQDEHGCIPYAAQNGREALDILSRLKTSPCLILLDMMMPVMNGTEFLDVLQKDEARAKIPVTVMSAAPIPSVKTSGGALRKPFTVDALHRTIRTHCGTKHMQKPHSSLSRLAALLRDQKEDLLKDWMSRSRNDPRIPHARDLDDEEFRNNIPKLIDELIASLQQTAQKQGPRGASAQEIGGGKAAREHAHHREHAGYSLGEELREMTHLRGVLLGMCAREKLTLEGDEARFLHEAIDEEMTTAAVELEQMSSASLRRDVALRELFTAILGHDLRTPLTGIVLASSKLLQHSDVPDGLRKDHRRIAANADRMKRLIDDLLDMTRVRSRDGGLPIERKPCDFKLICEQTLGEVQLAFPDRAIELRSPDTVPGDWDPDRLAQLVQNLVRNAIDYSPADSLVGIEVREEDGAVALVVHNLGTPIPRELMPEIFDPFRQGDPARPSKGLGLGLFIAKEIVESHEGSIHVTSDEEHGTTFTVSLPRSV